MLTATIVFCALYFRQHNFKVTGFFFRICTEFYIYITAVNNHTHQNFGRVLAVSHLAMNIQKMNRNSIHLCTLYTGVISVQCRVFPLQTGIKNWLTTLQRAENLRKHCKKKEHKRTRFYKDPLKFVKDLFVKEQIKSLKTSREELEEHLEKVHRDAERHEQVDIPIDIPTIHPHPRMCYAFFGGS